MIGLEESSGSSKPTLDQVMVEIERVIMQAIEPFVNQTLTPELEEEIRLAVMATAAPKISEFVGDAVCLIPLDRFVEELIQDWRRVEHP